MASTCVWQSSQRMAGGQATYWCGFTCPRETDHFFFALDSSLAWYPVYTPVRYVDTRWYTPDAIKKWRVRVHRYTVSRALLQRCSSQTHILRTHQHFHGSRSDWKSFYQVIRRWFACRAWVRRLAFPLPRTDTPETCLSYFHNCVMTLALVSGSMTLRKTNTGSEPNFFIDTGNSEMDTSGARFFQIVDLTHDDTKSRISDIPFCIGNVLTS